MSAHGVAIIEFVVNIGTWGHKFGFRNVFIQSITKVLTFFNGLNLSLLSCVRFFLAFIFNMMGYDFLYCQLMGDDFCKWASSKDV